MYGVPRTMTGYKTVWKDVGKFKIFNRFMKLMFTFTRLNGPTTFQKSVRCPQPPVVWFLRFEKMLMKLRMAPKRCCTIDHLIGYLLVLEIQPPFDDRELCLMQWQQKQF